MEYELVILSNQSMQKLESSSQNVSFWLNKSVEKNLCRPGEHVHLAVGHLWGTQWRSGSWIEQNRICLKTV